MEMNVNQEKMYMSR